MPAGVGDVLRRCYDEMSWYSERVIHYSLLYTNYSRECFHSGIDFYLNGESVCENIASNNATIRHHPVSVAIAPSLKR